jgi:hypothetical protein
MYTTPYFYRHFPDFEVGFGAMIIASRVVGNSSVRAVGQAGIEAAI